MIYIRSDIKNLFDQFKQFEDFMSLEIDIVRDFKNRKTGRFEIAGKGFYIKKHFACGVGAVADELFHLRKPHIGAQPERVALDRLGELGIDTMRVAAFGLQGKLPHKQQSFLVTDELLNVQCLESLSADWINNPPAFKFKKMLIEKVAKIAKKLHGAGINHRDFYICHFMLDLNYLKNTDCSEEPRIYLIDLHRACQRELVPFRWLVKDIGGLLFSALDIGLTRQDFFRFVKIYTGKSLRETFSKDAKFWKAVIKRAIKTYKRDFKKYPDAIEKLI